MKADRPPRVDPRRPWVRGPSGLRRIVLGAEVGQRGAAPEDTAAAATPPLRSAGPFEGCVLVVTHTDRGALDETARQVIAAAAITASASTELVLAVIGDPPEDLAGCGVDRCVVAPPARAAAGPAAVQPWLQALALQLQPGRTLFPDRGADAELGRRHAVACGLPVACGVREWRGDRVRLRAVAGQDRLAGVAPVMLLERGVAEAELPWRGLGVRDESLAGEAADPPAHGALEDLGLQPGDPSALPLEEADLIVAAGAGVRDLALLARLAEALGAAVGASRVAVDAGHFPRSRQIGATGRTVSAAGYLAIGISGAVQHLQGIRDCRHVIAVNTDPAAPITRRAALSVVEDSSGLMAALLDAVEATRRAGLESRR